MFALGTEFSIEALQREEGAVLAADFISYWSFYSVRCWPLPGFSLTNSFLGGVYPSLARL